MNKKILNCFKQKKASAILISIGIISVMLALAIGVASITVQNITLSKENIVSTMAFYRAEAGIERGLLDYAEKKDGIEDKETFGIRFDDEEDKSVYSVNSAVSDIYYDFNYKGEEITNCEDANSYEAMASVEPHKRKDIPFYNPGNGENNTEFRILYGSNGEVDFAENTEIGTRFMAEAVCFTTYCEYINTVIYNDYTNSNGEITHYKTAKYYEDNNGDFIYDGSKTFGDFLLTGTKKAQLQIINTSDKKAFFCIDKIDGKIMGPDIKITSTGIINNFMRKILVKNPRGEIHGKLKDAIHY